MGYKGEEEIVEEAKEERKSLEREKRRVKYNAQFVCKIEASNKSNFNIVIAAKYHPLERSRPQHLTQSTHINLKLPIPEF